jgi:hypothetical protein
VSNTWTPDESDPTFGARFKTEATDNIFYTSTSSGIVELSKVWAKKTGDARWFYVGTISIAA